MLTLLVSCTVYCTSSHPPRAARFDPFYRKVSETVGPTIVFPPLCKREKGRVSAVFGRRGDTLFRLPLFPPDSLAFRFLGGVDIS